MIENDICVDGRFLMRVNFNLVKKNGSDKSQIWLTSTINNERARIYTGLRIEPQYWIKTKRTQIGERALESNNLGQVQKKYNQDINKELSKILGYCNEYGIAVSHSNLLVNNLLEHSRKNFEAFVSSKIRGVEFSIRKNPADFINDYIERKSMMVNKDTQRKIAIGTVYNHRNALKRLQTFCHEKRFGFVWELFNARLEENFTAWMIEREYTSNTISSQYSIMKVWLSAAELEGIIKDKSFHRYRTTTQDVDNIYLTETEIQRIYELDFSSKEIQTQIDDKSMIEQVRDLFVVACWTGLRFGDWSELSKADLTDKYMYINTRKTNKTITIPLHPYVRNIIKKYNNKLPNGIDKTHSLRHIRKCGELAGINEVVSLSRVAGGKTVIKKEPKYNFIMNHTARRSFATNMYLRRVPTITIMHITGHTSEANFLKYIKISPQEHADIAAKAFEGITDL